MTFRLWSSEQRFSLLLLPVLIPLMCAGVNGKSPLLQLDCDCQSEGAEVPNPRSLSIAMAILLSLTLSACGTQPGGDGASSTSDILTRELPSSTTAEGVLLAAILLRAGDIDEAVSQGIVTPTEVSEAHQAFADDTLDLWRQRAEQEAGQQ